MSDQAGTVELLALELGKAISTLEELLSPEIFVRLGVELPHSISSDQALLTALQSTANFVGTLPSNIEALSTAIAAEDTDAIIAASRELFEGIAGLIPELKTVGERLDILADGLTGTEKDRLKTLAPEFALRVLEYVCVGYFDQGQPNLTSTFAFLGLIDKEAKPSVRLDVSQSENKIVPRRFHLDRLPTLFTQPLNHLENIYDWGKVDFDGKRLFVKLQDVLETLGVPASIYTLTDGSQVLEAYAFNLEIDSSGALPALLFNLSLPGNASLNNTIDLSSLWKGTVDFNADFEAGMAISITPPFNINFSPPQGNVNLNAIMGLVAEKPGDERVNILSIAGGTSLDTKRIGGSVALRASLDANGGKVVPEIKLFIEDGQLRIDTSGGDGFIQNILSNLKINADFDISAIWSPDEGLNFQGDAGLEIQVPLHIDLALVVLRDLFITIGISEEAPLKLDLATSIQTQLGPLSAVVEKIGVTVKFNFPEGGGGNFGMVNVDFGFKPPNGVGLSLDTGVIKGGGYLFLDFDREEYAGALELVFSEWIALKAIGLITTKMPDGSKGFSMVIIITAEFGAGIQLGFGFTLLGVGGILGLNRVVNVDPLVEGVKTGAIESVLFPQDVVANAPRIISDLRTFFPVQEGQFLIGPMAKIGYGTPTLVARRK